VDSIGSSPDCSVIIEQSSTVRASARWFNYYRTMTGPMPHPDVTDLTVTEVLFALSDPSRLAIVRQLAAGPRLELSCQTVGGDIPKSTRSHHLKTLREAGVIRSVPHGRQRFVSLRSEDLEARFPGLLAAVLAGAAGLDLPDDVPEPDPEPDLPPYPAQASATGPR
jgi:DNA-binding transcriptional ArsR family regulator